VEVNNIISSGLLELYAAGLASQDEAAQVQQWVQQYPEVADELAAIEASLAMYAQANALQPDASVKEKLFERINEGDTAKVIPLSSSQESQLKVVKIPSAWKNVAAAAIVLLIGSTVFNIVQFNKSKSVNEELAQTRQQAAALAQEKKQLEDEQRDINRYVETARNKYSQSVSVTGLNAADSSAKIFWMKNTGDVFVDPANLPALPADKQYELWAIVDGAPVNAGIIINTEKGTYRVQQMKAFGSAVKVQAFAVSVEPKSATPAVTPTVVYAVGPI